MFLIFLVLIPTGALVFVANVDRQKAEKETIRREAVCAAKLAAASQAYYVRQTRQLLATMTQFPFLVLLKDADAARKGMANLKLLSPDYSDFGLIERDGTLFCHTLETNTTRQIVSAAFAGRVLKEPKFAMSELYRDSVSRESVLQFAYPVFEANRELRRLMYGSLKIPLLSSALADIHLPAGGIVTVTDRAGNIVAQHPAAQKSVEGRLPSFPFVQQALAKTTNLFESAHFESARHLYAVSAVDDGGTSFLYVQVSVPRKLLFADADARFGGSLIGMLVIGSIVLFIAWRFSKSAFVRPVAAMLSATEQLIDGNLSARTGVTGRSELHVLAQRFDVMAETLGQRQNQLEAANAEITRSNAELEHRVEKRTEELKALNGELEAFSYSVSHDLQAPLRHIDGFAQLLAGDESSVLSATGQRNVEMITKAATQMRTLIGDLLSFSKMTRQEMAVERVNTAEMVNSIIEEAKAEEPDRQITWEIQALPAVYGDTALLRQVWLNLISNAVKYTRGRTPSKIEIFSFEDRNDDVFVVADNGAGFDMANAQKLFGVFQRLHRQEEFPGTGIGLANVRRIINRHGGRTWAEGEVGKGAKFFFTVPKRNI